MFRSCLILSALLLSLSAVAEDFYYNKALIYEKEFNKLFEQFEEILYSDGKKIYDLRVGCDNRHVKDANAIKKCRGSNAGLIKAKIDKVVDKKTFLLKIGKSLICIQGNTDTTGMEAGAEFEGAITPSGKFETKDAKGKKKFIRKYVQLTPISRAEFKKYIKKRKLHTYKKVEKEVAARTKLCSQCMGKGSRMQNLGKGKAGFRKCKTCKGKGTRVANWKDQVTWVRKDIE